MINRVPKQASMQPNFFEREASAADFCEARPHIYANARRTRFCNPNASGATSVIPNTNEAGESSRASENQWGTQSCGLPDPVARSSPSRFAELA